MLLPPLDVAGRSARVREAMVDHGCDALVVSDLVNVRYLSGFTGSAGVLVVRPDDLVLITDGRYREQAADQLAAAGVDADLAITRETDRVLADAVQAIDRVGLEADHVTWDAQRRWSAAIAADVVPTVGLVLGLRAVKDEGEVARLERAAAIADEALAEVRGMLDQRPTEREMARALESAMLDRGAAGPSFETIVASGPNGAKPHARPSDRVIGSSGEGELVVIDFGALYDGYHSDMTRTFAVGEPSPTQQRMLDVVASAQ
ncbi:MAG: M24 family metallopeptidase, partial [Acidimicrobiia bacterium]